MRKKVIWLEFLILIVVAAAIYFIVGHFNNVNVSVPKLIPQETEKKVGDLVLKELIRKYPKVTDKRADEALKIIHKRLAKDKKFRYSYTYTIVKSETINAVTLPGGHVVIFSGLIDVLDNAEQLAAVIGHEIGHTELNHIISRLVKTFGLQVLFTVIGGGEGVLLTEIMHMILSNSFNREQEEQADEFGLKLLFEQKINPHHLASVFRKFKESTGDLPDYAQVFSTHPNHDARIRQALEYPLDVDFKEEKINVSWQSLKQATK